MPNQKGPPAGRQGFAHILLLLLLLAGIALGVYLVQQKTNLLPKAFFPGAQPPEFAPSTSLALIPILKTQTLDGSSQEEDVAQGGSVNIFQGGTGGSVTPHTVRLSYYLGEEILVKLYAASDIDEANLFVAKIKFDKDLLEVQKINYEGTFVNNWVEQNYDNSQGTISLVGGVPLPGYKTTPGNPALMAAIVFKGKVAGSTTISFTDESAIYRNSDNINILTVKVDATIAITEKPATVFEAGFNVSGITHYGYPDLFPHSASSQIETTLKEIQSMNSKIIRVFVANKQISDEEAARRLDDFLTKAAAYNISVIASLIDFYDSGFSPQGINYTRCDFTPCLLGSDFFNDGYKGRYKQFVQTVIEKNKNHSNIYAWEIGNELKYESDPQVFINFMKYISSFVKVLDPSHLVATGMLSAGHTGLSPTALYSQVPRIDIITIHQYNGDRSGLGDASWARTNNKKVILEEFGFGGTGDRSTSIRNELNFWKVEGPSAVLQWGFIAKGIPDNGNGDRDLGMDNIWHSDYDALFSLFKALNADHIAPTPTPTPTPTPLPSKKGDGNKDGKINLTDMSVLLTWFNKTGNLPPIDLNDDNTVNSFDFSLMRKLLIERGVIKGQ